MIAATARILLTQGLLSAQTVPVSVSSTVEDLPEDIVSKVLRTGPLPPGPFASTMISNVSIRKSAVQLSSPGADTADGSPRAVKDISHTTIDVNKTHLKSLVPMSGRPLATSFVQSALQHSDC
jgi:hypothetical protein